MKDLISKGIFTFIFLAALIIINNVVDENTGILSLEAAITLKILCSITFGVSFTLTVTSLSKVINKKRMKEWQIINRHTGVTIWDSSSYIDGKTSKAIAKEELLSFCKRIARKQDVPIDLVLDDYALVEKGKFDIKKLKDKYIVIEYGSVADMTVYRCRTRRATKAFIGDKKDLFYERIQSESTMDIFEMIAFAYIEILFELKNAFVNISKGIFSILRGILIFIAYTIVFSIITALIILYKTITLPFNLIKKYNETRGNTKRNKPNKSKSTDAFRVPQETYPGKPYDHV